MRERIAPEGGVVGGAVWRDVERRTHSSLFCAGWFLNLSNATGANREIC